MLTKGDIGKLNGFNELYARVLYRLEDSSRGRGWSLGDYALHGWTSIPESESDMIF